MIIRSFFSVLLLLIFGPPLLKGQASKQPQENKSTIQKAVLGNLQEIQSTSFRRRQQATHNLIQLGPKGYRELLRYAKKDFDLETQLRIKGVVKRIQTQFPLETLLIEENATSATQLHPGKIFFEIAKETQESKAFFAEVYRSQRRILNMAERNPKKFAEAIGEKLYDARVVNKVKVTELAAYLLISLDPKTKLSPRTNVAVCSIISMNMSKEKLKKNSFRSLVTKWILHEPQLHSSSDPGNTSLMDCRSYMVIDVAKRFELKEGLRVAHRILRNNQNREMRGSAAVLAIGKFGGKKDIPVLEKLFSDKNVVSSYKPTETSPDYAIQRRDVALAMCILLSGQDPKRYGFRYVPEPPRGPDIYNSSIYFTFTSDSQRSNAFRKWRQTGESN